MLDFNLHIPTELYFGRNKENEVGQILAKHGAKKVLLVYGQGSVIKSGLLGRVKKILDETGLSYVDLKGITPNPDVAQVREGIALMKETKADFILTIGGGSVIDVGKLISTGFYYEGDPYNISLKKVIPTKRVPLGVILTISAAGSEMSTSCVISNAETKTKTGYNSPLNRPVFAIENPELTYSVSAYQTAVGTTDILMHTLERYFNPSQDLEISDRIAEALIKTVMKAGLIALEEPDNYDARATLMLASTLSHNGLTSLGKGAYMPVHQFEHVISGFYEEVAHGAGLAVMFPAWMEYYRKLDVKKFSQFAKNVFNYDSGDDLDNSRYATVTLKSYFKQIGMPVSLKELGIGPADVPRFAARLTDDGTKVLPHHIEPVNYRVAYQIFELALGE